MNAPIPADVLRYWLNMTLQYTGCTGEQAKSVAEYAARTALDGKPCGVWHAMHVRASLAGREWIGVVAVLCLASTTALTALRALTGLPTAAGDRFAVSADQSPSGSVSVQA